MNTDISVESRGDRVHRATDYTNNTDVSGLDIGWRIRQHNAKQAGKKIDLTARFMNGQRYSALPDMLCEEGRFGRKAGLWNNLASVLIIPNLLSI